MVNLGAKAEREIVFVGTRLDRELKNQLFVLVNECNDVFT